VLHYSYEHHCSLLEILFSSLHKLLNKPLSLTSLLSSNSGSLPWRTYSAAFRSYCHCCRLLSVGIAQGQFTLVLFISPLLIFRDRKDERPLVHNLPPKPLLQLKPECHLSSSHCRRWCCTPEATQQSPDLKPLQKRSVERSCATFSTRAMLVWLVPTAEEQRTQSPTFVLSTGPLALFVCAEVFTTTAPTS